MVRKPTASDRDWPDGCHRDGLLVCLRHERIQASKAPPSSMTRGSLETPDAHHLLGERSAQFANMKAI